MRVAVAITGPDADAARAMLTAAGHEVHSSLTIGSCNLVVVDEWTPETAPVVQEARAHGIPVTILAELILDRARGPVVGITGTAGKTSTARALADLLGHSGVPHAISHSARSSNAWPDHSLAHGTPDGAVLIAELTSTHLCHMRHVHPDVAVITTIRPDHAELHGGLARYVDAKRRIVAELTEEDSVVLPSDDPETLRQLGPVTARRWSFGSSDPSERGAFATDRELVLRDDDGCLVATMPTPRGPARRSIAAAASTALALGIGRSQVAEALEHVRPVPHRLTTVVTADGPTLIDDTMAATPMKALAGIRAVAARRPVIIMGGDDAPGEERVHHTPEEESVLADAVRAARSHATALLAFGPAAARVQRYVTVDAVLPDIVTALQAGLAAAGRDGVVLVSPMFPMRPEERMMVAEAGS